MRAMSLRTSSTRWVFSIWPVAVWKRRLNCSFFRFSSVSDSWSGVMPRTSSIFITRAPRRPASMRVTMRVFIGSLAAPRRRASRATSSGTPSISNMIRPGCTRAAQYSTAPLPLPIRTSAGLSVTGTSGKMRIHTRPWRFIWRVIARRAASIWRAVMRSGSTDFRP